MRRRAAVLVMAGAGAWPLLVLAQRRVPRPAVGFLNLISREADSRVPAFVDGMRRLGYIEGKSVVIEWRFAGGNAEKLANLALELVRLKVDVIVAVQTQAIEAARRATSTIPIVFAATQDPVASGYAKTLSRPGGNTTGISSLSAEMAPKQLELLKLALPQCSRIALLANPTNHASAPIVEAMERAAAKVGLRMLQLNAATLEQIEAAMTAAVGARSEAVVVLGDSFFVQSRSLIAKMALRHRLATMFVQREHVVAGGLMSYGPSIEENYRRVAFYVDRIVKGADPAELPIEQPSKFDLVINIETAGLLGLKIAESILVRADEVIK